MALDTVDPASPSAFQVWRGESMTSRRVLGITVPGSRLRQWRDWLMPAEQPFLVPPALAERLDLPDDPERLTFEVKDSFWLYDLAGSALCWLTRADSARLPAEVRRGQPAPHRWPSADVERDLDRVVRFVETGRRTSRHREVTERTWDRLYAVLPGARALAGTFPDASGPNCFGTVMAAAGTPGADSTWMQREPFESWLAESTVAGGRDDDPGTVLVWRDREGQVQHAAVTLGDGWALHKPSQGWMSPTKVLGVREVIFSARQRGHHLERRQVTQGAP
jgi:hypothetical protein